MHRKPLMTNFLRLFLPTAAFVLAGIFFYGQSEIERDASRLMSRETLHVGLGAGTLSRHLEGITRDLTFLASHSALQAAVNAPTPANIGHLAEDLANFSRSSGIYDQLRWIDETGMERVRIDYIGGQGIVIPADKLQNKGQRYFFTDANRLKLGEIFVSPLDLNIEQNKIELPHKPMLRVATPVADTQGRKRGIIILNFYGQVMLDAFAASTQEVADHAMVLNAEGYRLKSPVPANDWAFMFKRADLSLAAQDPLAWAAIASADSGQKWLADGLWSWQTVYPLLAGQRSSNGAADAAMPSSAALGKKQYFWKAVTHLPSNTLLAMRQEVWGRLALVALLLLGVLAAGCWKLAHARTRQEAAEAEIRIAATAFESQEGMLITDAQAVILRVNKAFCSITGYSAEEVVGRNPSLLKSGVQSADFYAAMWECIHASGNWMGEIWNKRKNGEIYPEHLTITAVKNAADQVTNYVATLVDITVSKVAAAEIEQLAFYDPLTALPNRRLLLDRIKRALVSTARSGRDGALLFMDLDNFKNLNDTHGHDTGDLLLQQVARRLESCVRKGDTVARIGGDEFVVLLEDLSEQDHEAADQAKVIGYKILATLNQPYRLGEHEHHSTLSIGVALFYDHSRDFGDLLKQADIAMYQAKHAGRNTLRFYQPTVEANSSPS